MKRPKLYFLIIKRLIDIISSIILIILFMPIMIVTAILIKIGSPGPAIFKQKRVGENKLFWMYKFRSMYVGDNDKILKEKYPELWEKYKRLDWKLPMDEDPRITPIGKKIRSLTIDEFPQFFNVLIGNMSLVGPRAYRNEELIEHEKKYPHLTEYIKTIRSAKPGITGPWQVSGRNDIPFEKRAVLDADYIRRQSLLEEIKVILKTPLAMISRW